jgi:hypothetical protein
MKIYLSISLIVSVLFMVLFGADIFALLATAHPVPDLTVRALLFVLFALQAGRSMLHLKNFLKGRRDENL